MNESVNQSQTKPATQPVTNPKLNSDDRLDALNALRRKVGRLIESDAVVIQEINQEAEETVIEGQDWVSFRCTPEQKLMLKSACQERGISVSDWVKARVFDLPLPQPRRVKLPYATIQNAIALNRIGVNLNQLMRKLKQDEFVEETRLMQCIAETQALLQQVQVELSSTEEDDR